MHKPLVDIILLSLLILFFGMQQRSRPQRHFRFWFVGWLFVLLSYIVWGLQPHSPFQTHVQEVFRFDLLLAGALTFLVSFVTDQERLPTVIRRSLAVGLPVVFLINLAEFAPVPRLLLIVVVLLWQAQGIRSALHLLPWEWPQRRFLVSTVCVAFAVAIPLYMWVASPEGLTEWSLAEVMLCTAILYGGGSGPRSVARFAGSIGFALWAAFYLVALGLQHHPHALSLLFEFWDCPKFFVGFSMILRVFEDTTQENAELAEQYRLLYEDFHLLYESHPYPLWTYTAETGQILSVNRQAIHSYGYTQQDFLQLRIADIALPRDAETDELDRLVPSVEEGTRVRHRFQDGSIVWMNVVDHAIVFQGRPARLLLACDITERLQASQKLAFHAHHDALTGLPNRTLLADRLQQCLVRCQRDRRKAVLLTIDIDHFKRVNDTYGHLIGDECLRQASARLATKIRQIDTIARIGGEEFAAIVGGLSSLSDAEKIAASLLRQFDEPLSIGELDLCLTVSIGAAVYPDDGEEAADLQALSDRALYQAKNSGRNRAVFAAHLNTQPSPRSPKTLK